MRKYSLALAIFALTIVFVVLGYTMRDKLKVVYMRQGASTLSHNAPAGTPAAAVQRFYSEVQRRDFDSAYNYVANKQDVDRDTFIRDIRGSDGDLRSLAALSDFDTQQLSTDGSNAKVRANLQWATAVGAYYETRDLKVVNGKSGWQVEWKPEEDVTVPPQVVAVNYPRWDLIRPDSAGPLANESLGKPKLRMISQQIAQDADTVVVFGEIANDDSRPAYVDVKGVLVGKDDKDLGKENSFDVISHTLLPGEKTPYRIDFPGVNRDQVANVKLSLDGAIVPASGDPIVSIQDAKLQPAAMGRKSLQAKLLNQSGDAINIPEVIAAYYGADGHIVWVDNLYVNHAALPQTSLAFSMGVPEKVAGNVQSFSLRVNSYRLD